MQLALWILLCRGLHVLLVVHSKDSAYTNNTTTNLMELARDQHDIDVASFSLATPVVIFRRSLAANQLDMDLHVAAKRATGMKRAG